MRFVRPFLTGSVKLTDSAKVQIEEANAQDKADAEAWLGKKVGLV